MRYRGTASAETNMFCNRDKKFAYYAAPTYLVGCLYLINSFDQRYSSIRRLVELYEKNKCNIPVFCFFKIVPPLSLNNLNLQDNTKYRALNKM